MGDERWRETGGREAKEKGREFNGRDRTDPEEGREQSRENERGIPPDSLRFLSFVATLSSISSGQSHKLFKQGLLAMLVMLVCGAVFQKCIPSEKDSDIDGDTPSHGDASTLTHTPTHTHQSTKIGRAHV